MIRRPQSKLGGSLGKEIDALWDAVAAAQVNNVTGGKIDRTSSGTTIKFDAVEAESDGVDLVNVIWPDPFDGDERYAAAVDVPIDPITGVPDSYPWESFGYQWRTSAPVDLNQSWLIPLEQTLNGWLTGRTTNGVGILSNPVVGGTGSGASVSPGASGYEYQYGRWPYAIPTTGATGQDYLLGFTQPAGGWDLGAGWGHGGTVGAVIPAGTHIRNMSMTGPRLTNYYAGGYFHPFDEYDMDWTPIDWTDGAVDLTKPGLWSNFTDYPVNTSLNVPNGTEVFYFINLTYSFYIDTIDPATGNPAIDPLTGNTISAPMFRFFIETPNQTFFDWAE